MALKTKILLSLVIPGRIIRPTSTREMRISPVDIGRKTWDALCSLRGQLAMAWVIVLVLVALDSLLVGQHALLRYHTYHADAFDLGNMDQAIWNSLHGHLLRFTNRGMDWFGPPTRLGVHVEPILLLIAPLYLLHTGPETLILLQAVTLALGSIPLFLLGLRRLPELPLVAAAFVGAYLATPEILGEALFDFHGVALATPLLLLTLWAVEARRYRWLAIAAVLAALCKEEVALSLIPLGFYIAIWQGRPRLGATVLLLSTAWVAFCFLVILPHYNIHTAGANNFWYRYAWLGSSPDTALHRALTQPSLLLSSFQDSARRDYLAVLLRSGGGLGIFAPALWLCALPDIMINALSTHAEQYSGFYHYNAVILPYLMVAAIYGTEAFYHTSRRVESRVHPEAFPPGAVLSTTRPTRAGHAFLSTGVRWQAARGHFPIRSQWISPLVMVWLIVSAYWNITATISIIRPFWLVGNHSTIQQAQIDALLANVPPSASVAATDTLNPHLSDRYTIFLLPDPQSYTADYIAIDIPAALYTNQQADQEMYEAMLTSGGYRIVGIAGQVVLLQRLSLSLPVFFAPIADPSSAGEPVH